MEIQFSKKFIKQLKKLNLKQQQRFWSQLDQWKTDPNHPSLRTHKLSGNLTGFESINIGGDLRALYRRHGKILVIYEMIGTHSQLYG